MSLPPSTFRLCSGAPRRDDRPLTALRPLGEGDWVSTSDGQRLRLGRRLGEGGEGAVYATDARVVCKIYSQARRTAGTKQKLELMVSARLARPGICWPLSVASTPAGEFVGYVMPEARGRELQRNVFVKQLLQQLFPRWNRLQLAKLTTTILELIAVLHRHNVLLGDINPLNILVVDETTVHLVDTDSYQVEDHPCPVGTATFLPPELIGINLSEVLRTFDHEHFALATLVFMLLVPGKPPYSHTGGGDPAQNVRDRQFPYPLRDLHGKGVPAGPWRFIWSHLPLYLKDAFHSVFASGHRPAVEDWLAHMKRYAQDLDRGYLSAEIFPSRFKPMREEEVRRKGGEWVRCAECGEGFGRFAAGEDLCATCRAHLVPTRCAHCGRDFATTRGHAKRLAGRSLCPRCRPTPLTCLCRECGAEFTMSGAEQAFYRSKGLTLPRRCRSCRRQRRVATAA